MNPSPGFATGVSWPEKQILCKSRRWATGQRKPIGERNKSAVLASIYGNRRGKAACVDDRAGVTADFPRLYLRRVLCRPVSEISAILHARVLSLQPG